MSQAPIPITPNWIVHPTTGTATLRWAGRTILDGATAGVTYRIGDRRYRLSLQKHHTTYGVAPGAVDLRVRDGYLELNWGLRASSALPDAVEVRLEATNVGRKTVYLDELQALVLDATQGGQVHLGVAPPNWSCYMHGWQSWSPVFVRNVNDSTYSEPATKDYIAKHVPHQVPRQPPTLTSEWVGVVTGRRLTGDERLALLLGFITAKDQLAEVRLQVADEQFAGLVAVSHADGIPLAPGERVASETLLVAPGEPYMLLETWAAELGRCMGARIPPEVPTGWCTWYYFYGLNGANDILANLAEIERQRLPLNWVVIDDGYQSAIGDWLSPDRRRFPEGMDGLARQITAAGHQPMLWIAPFGAGHDSRLYAEHPAWVLRDPAGEPVLAWIHDRKPVYALDPSHPGVQDWLRHLFRVLSQDWGFAGFKLDFIFAAALPGQRYDSRMTRAQAFRRGLEIIRESVGDRFLLGCGAPIGPSVGLVDAMRIGPDVATTWKSPWQTDLSAPAGDNAVRNVLTRAYQHQRLWINDPDCALVRGQDESALHLAEVRTLASIIALSGGMVIDSDNFPTLQPARIDILRHILPPFGQAARPLDLFDHQLPRLFVLPVEREWGYWRVVGVVNWSDHITRTTIDLSRLGFQSDQAVHAYDFWHRRYLGIAQGRLTLSRQLPHETTVLLLKPVSDQPDFLTSTFHVTQGAVEVQSVERRATSDGGLSLVVHLEKPGRQSGQLLFTCPAGWQAVSAEVNGRPVHQILPVADGIVAVQLRLEDDATIQIVFATGTQ